jgi:hypothetical protein
MVDACVSLAIFFFDSTESVRFDCGVPADPVLFVVREMCNRLPENPHPSRVVRSQQQHGPVGAEHQPLRAEGCEDRIYVRPASSQFRQSASVAIPEILHHTLGRAASSPISSRHGETMRSRMRGLAR